MRAAAVWSAVWLLGVAATGAFARADAQQRDTVVPRPTGSAIIAGTVVSDELPPRPLRRASVGLAGTGIATIVEVVTDDAGRFAFAGLPGGRYTLIATKPSFVKTFHGSKAIGRGPAAPLVLTDGQRMTDVTIVMVRGAVIAGTVIDQDGMPVASAGISLEQWTVVNGERKLTTVPGLSNAATTDELGRYRVYGLTPGEYAVRVGQSSGFTGDVRETTDAEIAAALRDLQTSAAGSVPPPLPSQVTYSGSYYPNAADASGAQFITLAAGEERLGVDIKKTLVRTIRARVDGTAVGPAGQPLSNILVGVANVSTGSVYSSPGIVRPGLDGKFSVFNLPPGRWMLFGRGMEGDGQLAQMPLWAETEFDVTDHDIAGLVLQLLPGVNVSGRLVFAGSQPATDATKMRIGLTALPRIPGAVVNVPSVVPQADGTFTIVGVSPGKYRVTVSGNGAWSLRSAMLGGRDVLDAPLDIAIGADIRDLSVTFTDQPAQVTGTLFDKLGRPTPEYAVVMFSTDRTMWATAPRRMTGAVKLGSDGKFAIKGLPPGEYYLSAIVDIDPGQLTDPAVLEQLAAVAIKVALGEGEKKTQDLRIGG